MNLYLSDRCALSIAGLFMLVLCSVSQAHEWHGRTDGSERFMHANLGVLADIPVYRWLSEGYKTFRIPGIVQSAKGTIITAAEGRVSTDRPYVGNASICYGQLASRHDSSCVDKDIVVKISKDEGTTWEPVQAITKSNATHFYSNPDLLLDTSTSAVWLIYYQCLVAEVYRHCVPLVTSSKDNGVTWESSRRVDAVTSYHIGGLGGGIQLHHQSGDAENRLIFPHGSSGIIYSDDHGQTWQNGNHSSGVGGECQAAELFDGSLVMSSRAGGYSPTFCKSGDGGLTFTACHAQTQLLSDNCETSLLAVPKPQHVSGHFSQTGSRHYHSEPDLRDSLTMLVFSHPNSLNKVEPLGRQNMTLSVSHDNGETWHAAVTINGGPSAYSALTQIEYKGKRAVACLYERSKDGPPVDFDTVAMAIIDIETLL